MADFTRRSVLAGVPVVVAAAALPAVALADTDPMLAPYEQWCAATREWLEIVESPGHGNNDTPEALAAWARREAAADEMQGLTPTTFAGIAACAHLLTDVTGSAFGKDDDVSVLISSIWRAATDGAAYPEV